MAIKIAAPKFNSEAEEAEWLYVNRKKLASIYAAGMRRTGLSLMDWVKRERKLHEQANPNKTV